jgi:DNA repair photolyase
LTTQDDHPSQPSQSRRRRGAQIDPPNRFESTRREADLEHLEHDEELKEQLASGAEVDPRTQFFPDHAKSVLTRNDSPDVGFEFSVNPYRGCEHGCSYCYARPTHETLGMNAGLDFETKIYVKHDAPALLRAALAKPSWQPAPIALSGVTDCYQPAERRFRLTRRCLEVLLEHRNPAIIVTKNVLLLRDLDVLRPMAERGLIQVRMSVTTLDPELQRAMEPRTATPAARLDAIRRLTAAGIPVGVLMAPLIPALTDKEIPAVLQAVAAAGARAANYVLLRLPLAVRPIFLDWLERHAPLKRPHVEALLRDARDGALNNTQFGSRMVGTGAYAESIRSTFKLFARRYGLDGRLPPLAVGQFRHEPKGYVQRELLPP